MPSGPGGPAYATMLSCVVVNPLPVAIQPWSSRRQGLCPGQQLALAASPQPTGSTYRWQDGSSQATLLVGVAGRYRLEVSSPAGCPVTARLPVEVFLLPTPHVTLGADTTACVGNVRLRPNTQPAGSTYRWAGWQPPIRAVVAQESQAIIVLTVRNATGCLGRATRRLIALCRLPQSTAHHHHPQRRRPEPNLRPQRPPRALTGTLRLYNRWGREIYAQEQYDNYLGRPGPARWRILLPAHAMPRPASASRAGWKWCGSRKLNFSDRPGSPLAPAKRPFAGPGGHSARPHRRLALPEQGLEPPELDKKCPE